MWRRLPEVVNAQSPPELCGLWGGPYALLDIFRRGGRGGAAGRINEAQTVHPGLMCPWTAVLPQGPLAQWSARPGSTTTTALQCF